MRLHKTAIAACLVSVLTGCSLFSGDVEPGRFVKDLEVDPALTVNYSARANDVISKALERNLMGETRSYQTADGRYAYRVTPVRTRRMPDGETYCQVYDFQLVGRGHNGHYRGGACRHPNGVWEPANISKNSPRRIEGTTAKPLPWHQDRFGPETYPLGMGNN